MAKSHTSTAADKTQEAQRHSPLLPQCRCTIKMTMAEDISVETVRLLTSPAGDHASQCKLKEARRGGGGNGLWERSLPFTHKYLKTINFGAAARKKYMKGKLISI